MRRRPQPHHVGTQFHRLVVKVTGDVVEGGDDRQGNTLGLRLALAP
jgi:hypothetical protein